MKLFLQYLKQNITRALFTLGLILGVYCYFAYFMNINKFDLKYLYNPNYLHSMGTALIAFSVSLYFMFDYETFSKQKHKQINKIFFAFFVGVIVLTSQRDNMLFDIKNQSENEEKIKHLNQEIRQLKEKISLMEKK